VPLLFDEELLSYKLYYRRNYQIWVIFLFLYKVLAGLQTGCTVWS